jgi:hypothetical protein
MPNLPAGRLRGQIILPELQLGLSSAKAASDIARGIQSLESETAINEAVIEIQRHVMETQQARSCVDREYAAALKRIDTLEQEIVRLKDWSAEKQRYELADTGQGSFAYRLKEGVDPPEPGHWICPHCYQKGDKSLLKHEHLAVGRADTLVCHPCGYDVVTSGVRQVQHRPTFAQGR